MIQLRTDEDILELNFISTANLSLSLDLGIATFCVLAIIPYLMKVNSIMKYEGGISKLTEEAAEAIDSNHKVTASNKIRELAELCKSAVNDMLKERKVIKIIGIMKNLGNNVADKEWADATFTTLEELKEIGLNCTKKKLDGAQSPFISATENILDGLKEVGVKAADKELERAKGFPVAAEAIRSLERIGVDAIDGDLSDDTVSASCLGLFEIGFKVAEKKLGYHGNPVGLIIRDPEISEEKYFTVNHQIVENIKEIANKAYGKNRNKFRDTSEGSMVYLWALGASVNKYLSIGHRLRPPFIPKSLSIDMRIKCLTLIDIHYSLKSSLNSIISKYKS